MRLISTFLTLALTSASTSAFIASIVAVVMTASIAQATWDSPHPVLDRENSQYRAPIDLASVSVKELIEYQKFYRDESVRLREIVSEKADEDDLLKALLAYDMKRVKLADIIPDMIKAYRIQDPLNRQLMAYAVTIQGIYDDYRTQIQSLEEYKPYDFRLGIAYSSMMTTIMTEDEKLYGRMQADMEKPNTVIGGYIKELELAYAGVEKVNAEIEEFHLLRQVERELSRISSELSQR